MPSYSTAPPPQSHYAPTSGATHGQEGGGATPLSGDNIGTFTTAMGGDNYSATATKGMMAWGMNQMKPSSGAGSGLPEKVADHDTNDAVSRHAVNVVVNRSNLPPAATAAAATAAAAAAAASMPSRDVDGGANKEQMGEASQHAGLLHRLGTKIGRAVGIGGGGGGSNATNDASSGRHHDEGILHHSHEVFSDGITNMNQDDDVALAGGAAPYHQMRGGIHNDEGILHHSHEKFSDGITNMNQDDDAPLSVNLHATAPKHSWLAAGSGGLAGGSGGGGVRQSSAALPSGAEGMPEKMETLQPVKYNPDMPKLASKDPSILAKWHRTSCDKQLTDFEQCLKKNDGKADRCDAVWNKFSKCTDDISGAY